METQLSFGSFGCFLHGCQVGDCQHVWKCCAGENAGSLFTSAGLPVRCDDILADVGAHLAPNSLFTWCGFQMSNRKNDHRPVCARIVVTWAVSCPVFRRRRPVYDRNAVYAAIGSTDPVTFSRDRAIHREPFSTLPELKMPAAECPTSPCIA